MHLVHHLQGGGVEQDRGLHQREVVARAIQAGRLVDHDGFVARQAADALGRRRDVGVAGVERGDPSVVDPYRRVVVVCHHAQLLPKRVRVACHHVFGAEVGDGQNAVGAVGAVGRAQHLVLRAKQPAPAAKHQRDGGVALHERSIEGKAAGANHRRGPRGAHQHRGAGAEVQLEGGPDFCRQKLAFGCPATKRA